MKPTVTFIPKISAGLYALMAFAVLMFSVSQSAAAQDSPVRKQTSSDSIAAGIGERFPPGSIGSVEIADQALLDVERERARAEAKFSDDERTCYPKFFVTSCMDAAKEERRRALAQIRQVEVEANAFKRRARVEERDKALAEKASKPAPIIKPPKEPKESDAPAKKNDATNVGNADRSGEAGRAEPAAATTDRVAEHNEKIKKLKEREAADAQKRAENVAAFEKKAREAEERQREVAARKAEKERKRAEKNPPRAP